jgi:hypothetical protein
MVADACKTIEDILSIVSEVEPVLNKERVYSMENLATYSELLESK